MDRIPEFFSELDNEWTTKRALANVGLVVTFSIWTYISERKYIR